MKKLILAATTCLVAMNFHPAMAAVSQAQADLLKTTLTPFGSIRAGSADGLVPAWTGGDTTPIPGAPSQGIPPSPYENEQPILSIDSGNYTKYQDKLSEGLIAMFKLYPDFKMEVYPSHRTAAAPQWVYDNIAKNAVNAKPAAGGILDGFVDAYGGIPFPIISKDDPDAGAELIWDHMSRWQGTSSYGIKTSYVVNNGTPTLAAAWKQWGDDPYYRPDGNVANFNGYMTKYKFMFIGPADMDGSAIIQWQKASGGLNDITTDWQYLNGQGRVREAPELQFDTPSGQTDDISNYDEYFMYASSPAEYNWSYGGEREMFIPYNNNNLFLKSPTQAMGPHFVNPDDVRFEAHRVYVVTATLRSGFRNVMAKRVFYIDEDTHTIALADEYDAKGKLYHVEMGFFENRPDVPMTFLAATVVYNLQTGQYAMGNGPWAVSSYTDPAQYYTTQKFPNVIYNAQQLAAQEQF